MLPSPRFSASVPSRVALQSNGDASPRKQWRGPRFSNIGESEVIMSGAGGFEGGQGGEGESSRSESEYLKKVVKATTTGTPFVLRRGRAHELDALATLSTDVFTPRGAWFDVWQNTKHLLMVWDLQAQFYNRFHNWRSIVSEFVPPLQESRYALLVAATPSGSAIGMTELCVAPRPVAAAVGGPLGLADTGPYLSNLAVVQEYRRGGIGQSLVRWCEELSLAWGHEVLYLHVDVSNTKAIKFYENIGFVPLDRDLAWYEQIGRQDLAEKDQLVLFKRLSAPADEWQEGDESGTSRTRSEAGAPMRGHRRLSPPHSRPLKAHAVVRLQKHPLSASAAVRPDATRETRGNFGGGFLGIQYQW